MRQDLYQTEPRKRSFLGRLLLYTTVGGALFYGGSTVAALNNDRYQDFFVESVPFGERIVDYLETHVGANVGGLNKSPVGEYGNKAIDLTKNAFGSVSSAVSRTFGAQKSEQEARTQMGEARDRAVKEGKKVGDAASKQAGAAQDAAQGAWSSVKEKTEQLVDQAKIAAEKAEAGVRSRAAALSSSAESTSDDAGKGIKGALKSAYDSVQVNTDFRPTSETPKAAPQGPPKQPYDRPLPVGHEAPEGYVAPRKDRGLKAEEPKGRLRPDPQAPKLPLLAPSVKGLSASEPVISQLAGTIDELAAFLRETPSSGATAKGVLESAQIDLQRLGKRLESVKAEEAKRVEKSLAEQAKKYNDQLDKHEKEAASKIDAKDTDWKQQFEQERKRQVEEYQQKLSKELETQSEIINERLREEVIAQGIELQRRWMRDIKARVEEERGGRLARLDELASDLKNLERVTLDNSSALDENVSVHTLWAALRAVASAIDGNEKRPFRDQLRALRNTPKAREDPVIVAALEVLDSTTAPDEGVESLSTLNEWFLRKVAPRVRSVALVPENAGILSHLASAALSPLLFHKRGLVDGDDVPSVLARAEYHLDRKDLDDAARELNQLKGWPKILVEDWLNAARRRLEAQQALDVSIVAHSCSNISLLLVSDVSDHDLYVAGRQYGG